MEKDPAGGRHWKHILTLALWLCLALPVGLWKLWEDETLTAADKWRILFYLCVVPFLLYVTLSVFFTNQTMQRMMP